MISFELAKIDLATISPKGYLRHRILRTLIFLSKDADLCNIALRLGLGLPEKVSQTINHFEQKIMDITAGNGTDVVLEMSGSEKGLKQGLRLLRKGGRISLFGLFPAPVQINLTNQIIFKGITMYGINGRIIFDTWERMHNLLKSGRLDISPVITHRLAFDDFEKGFELLMERPKKAVKVVMIM